MHSPDTIIALEEEFWQAMKDKDTRAAAALIADDALVAGARGTSRMSPARYEDKARADRWSLDSYDLSNVEVAFPAPNVAVIGYTARQTGMMGDDPMDLTSVESSTWINEDGEWKCALHTEVMLGDY